MSFEFSRSPIKEAPKIKKHKTKGSMYSQFKVVPCVLYIRQICIVGNDYFHSTMSRSSIHNLGFLRLFHPIPRLLTRPIQTHARGEGWPQTIIADAGRSGEARKLAHRAKRKWNIVDERSGGKCYRQGWLGRPIRGPGSKGGRAPREKAEEEDEDKIYRLELGARVLVPAPFLSSLRGP